MSRLRRLAFSLLVRLRLATRVIRAGIREQCRALLGDLRRGIHDRGR